MYFQPALLPPIFFNDDAKVPASARAMWSKFFQNEPFCWVRKKRCSKPNWRPRLSLIIIINNQPNQAPTRSLIPTSILCEEKNEIKKEKTKLVALTLIRGRWTSSLLSNLNCYFQILIGFKSYYHRFWDGFSTCTNVSRMPSGFSPHFSRETLNFDWLIF